MKLPRLVTAPVAGCALFLAGLVVSNAFAGNGTTITACVKSVNGQLRVVDSAAQCNPSEQVLTWTTQGLQGPQGPAGPAGPQGPTGAQGPVGGGLLKTIAGLMNADGTCPIPAGGGVVCTRIQTGEYELHFPPGTWTAFPVLNVTPFGLPGAFPIAEVGSIVGYGDGSATARILTSSSAGPWTPINVGFWFTAVQSAP